MMGNLEEDYQGNCMQLGFIIVTYHREDFDHKGTASGTAEVKGRTQASTNASQPVIQKQNKLPTQGKLTYHYEGFDDKGAPSGTEAVQGRTRAAVTASYSHSSPASTASSEDNWSPAMTRLTARTEWKEPDEPSPSGNTSSSATAAPAIVLPRESTAHSDEAEQQQKQKGKLTI